MTAEFERTIDTAVLTRFPQRRAFISALLICLQLFGLAHVAFARHLVSDTGAVLEFEGLAAEKHQDRGGHLCSDEATTHAERGEDCLVVSGWRSASLVAPLPLGLDTQSARVAGLTAPSLPVAQLEMLSRAPKASPPQG